MAEAPKTRVISLRLTEAQYQYLERTVERVRELTGMKVTRTSVILKLMEHGLPGLEREFPKPHPTSEDADTAEM